MRHSPLIGSALRANGLQLSRHHTQPRTILISLSRELSKTQLSSSRRPYSSSASPKPRPQPPTVVQPPPKPTPLPDHDLAPTAANPPATTRPPPLDLPDGPPDAPVISQPYFNYLFALGKAYLKFYKTGIKHIYTNTRLLYLRSTDPDLLAARPDPSTRAHLLLRERWRHDMRRLPLFALMLIVCGEFTPLVVLALPGAVPLPCRIPKQVDKLLKKLEERRREGRAELRAWARANKQDLARRREECAATGDGVTLSDLKLGSGSFAPVAKILGLSAPWWMPRLVVAVRASRRMKALARDDELLVQAGGAEALVPEEVRLACVDRGIDVLGRGDEELRAVLGRWLRTTDARRLGEKESKVAVMTLLGLRDCDWDRFKKE